jgi:hydrogenase maturation protease
VSGNETLVVIAGIGNEYRRDDGVGVVVANAVSSMATHVHDIGPVGEPLDLLGKWDHADVAVVIDATRSGAAPGTIVVSELDDVSMPHVRGTAQTSTHGLGLLDVMRLSRVLGVAPRRVVLVGVEGEFFGDGETMCAAVTAAVPKATAVVLGVVEGAS